ncbi:hypothetical protein SDC9_112291 [bioreactor metagenome]|uniref:Bacteriophage T5 Orf172 DNA-binding domain-containing protein n=1 Tax=bioreactor metagenome TaxID=1076179 RepID=A0A645BJ26_9ZZZZ
MFYKKAKLLIQKDEELCSLNETLKEKEGRISLLDIELQKVNSENQALKQKVDEKTKLLIEKEEELCSLKESLKEKEDSILLLNIELQKVNSENKDLKQRNDELNSKYSLYIEHDIEFEKKKIALNDLISARIELNEKYLEGLSIYNSLNQEIEIFKDTIEIGSFGLYQPRFNYDDTEVFKNEILSNFEKQKALIDEDKAILCRIEWTVNNSVAEGRRMTKKHKKLWLLAFNGECNSLISRVKWNNVEKSKERIIKTFEKLNQFGVVDSLEIQKEFLYLKLEELQLNYEYQLKKYEEKEEQKRIREQIREEEKALRDYEKAEREAEEEERYLQKALEKVKQKFGIVTPSEVDALNAKVKELEAQIKEAQEKKERAIALAQTTKVGYIYVISNIGTLGEDIYKIGMTRRLDPKDRVDELSNASVPFRFDVHATIFSEHAPQLEYELHKKFNDKRINRVNRRKEFFQVSLEEIEEFVKEHANAEIEFTKVAGAREYRETMTVLKQLQTINESIVNESKFPESLLS